MCTIRWHLIDRFKVDELSYSISKVIAFKKLHKSQGQNKKFISSDFFISFSQQTHFQIRCYMHDYNVQWSCYFMYMYIYLMTVRFFLSFTLSITYKCNVYSPHSPYYTMELELLYLRSFYLFKYFKKKKK